jgi:hypothetical protein
MRKLWTRRQRHFKGKFTTECTEIADKKKKKKKKKKKSRGFSRIDADQDIALPVLIRVYPRKSAAPLLPLRALRDAIAPPTFHIARDKTR